MTHRPIDILWGASNLPRDILWEPHTMANDPVELLQGTLDLLILKTLSWGSAHGYGIARWIQQVTGDVLHIEEGSLYPALHRLEKRGWIAAEWGLSENNRRAKFYQLTTRGRQQLRAESSSWSTFADAVSKVLTSTDQPSWAS
jgi:PadR family transcriptional regulator, regulatory protein PadR